MLKNPGRWCYLYSITMICTVLTACGNTQTEAKGDGGMFGLFGNKKNQTVVAAETGSQLQAQAAIPANLDAPPAASFSQCSVTYVRGTPPDASWANEAIPGETQQAFVVPASTSHPEIAILGKMQAGNIRVQLWEISASPSRSFVKRREVSLGAAQSGWQHDYPRAAVCLPDGNVLLSIGYKDPLAQEALYIYSPADNQFRHLAKIEPDMSTPPPFVSFETLLAGPDTVLIAYHTDPIRLGADNYAYGFDHVLLFSPQNPNGIEILKLSIDDGNIRAWGMQGKTLWLKTLDKRKKPVEKHWSLNLSKLL